MQGRSAQDVSAFVTSYLVQRGACDASLGDDFNYIDSGCIDSLGVMRLVSAIEERFDLELRDEDILSDAFRTIGGLVSIVAARRAAAVEV